MSSNLPPEPSRLPGRLLRKNEPPEPDGAASPRRAKFPRMAVEILKVVFGLGLVAGGLLAFMGFASGNDVRFESAFGRAPIPEEAAARAITAAVTAATGWLTIGGSLIGLALTAVCDAIDASRDRRG